VAISGQSHRIRISGVAAVVRLGYQKAATLGAWTVEGDMFAAEVVDVDGFRITQAPLTLYIHNKDGTDTRRQLGDVSVSQGRLYGRLLPRQV